MSERQLLVVERQLIEKIDENRGDVDREAFIRLCVESCLEGIGPARPERAEPVPRPGKPAPAPLYVSKAEFEEFRRGIRAVLHSFLDFYMTYGIEMGASRSPAELRRLKEQLRALIEEP